MTETLALHTAEETLEAVHTCRHAAYPAYKPSGVEWLGDVPEHWDVKVLKYIASINDEALPETTDPAFEFDYVDIGNVNATYGIVAKERMIFEEAPSRARRVVRKGDTIVSTVRTYLRAVAPVLEVADDLIVSTGFAVVRPNGVDPAFLSFALRESHFIETVVSRSTGVSYPAINASGVGRISVPLPSLEEQRAIARFLDEQTQKIDDLIEAKRSLLDLLKEKRQAVITHAVTRGLDPAAKLKPSDVEWLGDVPDHWMLTPLKHLTRFLNGMAFKPAQWSDEGYPIIRIENLNGGDSFNCFDGEVPHQYHVRQGDLLFGWSGNRGTSFGPFLWWREGLHYLNQHIFKLHAYKCDKNWFYWTLKSLTKYMEEEAHGIIGMVHITKGKLGAVKVPVPPLEEQQEIANFIDEETQKMDDLESVVREAIETLELLRASIISAAVTGKIDVREETAELG